MNDKLKHFTSIFIKKLGNKRTVSVILVLGICGMLLIGFSDIFSNGKKTTSVSNTTVSVEEYIKAIEKRTREMLASIDGAGKCKIMITAESSSEQNFATDDSISQDIQSDQTESKNKTDIEKEIVMVEDSNGKKVALVRNVTEPKIRGVLVLCEGADDIETKERITNAVKTLLGISSNKISVIKMK
ncbi:MAG: hypothetical protein IJ027_02250 [Oscillospiraceae bacterium]|nr:hypothetical protein [Oscillospiraceae bacterium]